MNEATMAGLGHGRGWATANAGVEAYEWTVDPQQGLVQGPLDLEFLRGHRIALNLADDQIALLVHGRDLKAIFLDGGHVLDVGRGDGQVSPDCHLVFVALTRGLDAAWTGDDPLRVGDDGAPVIGSCSVSISRPGRFFETFLAGLAQWDEAFLRRLIRQTVRAAVTGLLEVAAADPLGLQARLTALDPQQLDDELAPFGLSCARVAFYTASPPVEVAPAATAGHLADLRHN
ncbi:MAG TPA: hypothetical protein PLQ13_09485 [Candidatus Krumholzibacteria bacterium]|nr:hypothetical protein [Candidatus Krumholzibacteria bacterium]